MKPSDMTTAQRAVHTITTTYRKTIWQPFLRALKQYQLISAGDRIAVCISGGKDSMLLAMLLRHLQPISEVPFELTYLCMDPGYAPQNRARIEENAAKLELPLTFFETQIFNVADAQEKSPCYLCARMRRGALYAKAQELGCNKIALGHHFSDVVETTLMGMLWGAQIQGMLPKLRSQNFAGMELIRPMYCIHEDTIIAWARQNELSFLQCACRVTERNADPDAVAASKRQETKELLRTLRRTNPLVERNIFNSIHTASVDTMVGYKQKGKLHSFLEHYDES
jgi:tRNA(Ile)-lysidine synthase TilS/MesJ